MGFLWDLSLKKNQWISEINRWDLNTNGNPIEILLKVTNTPAFPVIFLVNFSGKKLQPSPVIFSTCSNVQQLLVWEFVLPSSSMARLTFLLNPHESSHVGQLPIFPWNPPSRQGHMFPGISWNLYVSMFCSLKLQDFLMKSPVFDPVFGASPGLLRLPERRREHRRRFRRGWVHCIAGGVSDSLQRWRDGEVEVWWRQFDGYHFYPHHYI